MTTLAVILMVGAGSLLFRVGPLLLLQRRRLSESGDRAIRYAGLAAISGLIGMSVQHEAHGASTVPTLLAVAVGAVLAARARSIVWILSAGGASYAVTLAFIGLAR
jgi:branched-subunit amino acid transport protein